MRSAFLMLTVAAGAASANSSLEVGDGQIDGTKLKAYDITWRQCSLQEDKWVSSNDLTERLVAIGDDLLRVQQFSERPDGSKAVATVYLERGTMAPIRLEYGVTAVDGSVMGKTEHALTDAGYEGRVTRGDQSKDVQGAVSSKQLNGGVMGLPLATLGYQDEPVEFPASMINFDATYKVIATWAGTETFEYNGQDVEAAMVDVHWIHNEIGDVYPGGPDASGGRYWLVQNPPDGFPYVPRYKTDTYAVEFIQGACPASESE